MNQNRSKAYKIVLTALLAALMSGGKLALSAIPNVEIVSLLLAVFAFRFGAKCSVTAAVVFCIVETFIWGFNTWVIEYLVHWPTVAVVFSILGKLKYKNNRHLAICATSVVVVLTFLFGVMTSVVDTFLAYSSSFGFVFVFKDFLSRFVVLYGRGMVFFAIHILSNCVLFASTFLPLNSVLKRFQI